MKRRTDIRALVAALVTALIALGVSLPAGAADDGDDVRGRLDLRSVVGTKDGPNTALVVSIRTWRGWESRALRASGPNRLVVLFDTDLDQVADFSGRVISSDSRLSIAISGEGQSLEPLPVSREGDRAITFTVPSGSPPDPSGALEIAARSRLVNVGACDPACRDRAPDAGWVVVEPQGGGGGAFHCTEVIGFSQTASWYAAFESVLPNRRWQLRAYSGGAVNLWSDPNYVGWTIDPTSPCDEGPPDRVLLTISSRSYESGPQWFLDNISLAIATIGQKYAGVREIVLQPVIGGPGHALCFVGGVEVRATHNHPLVDEAVAGLVGGAVVAGDSPEVRTCDDYADGIGHLAPAAAAAIGQAIGEDYA